MKDDLGGNQGTGIGLGVKSEIICIAWSLAFLLLVQMKRFVFLFQPV